MGKIKVAVYSRYSINKQNGQTIETQIRECKEAIEAKNPGANITEYIDEEKTGTTIENRTGYQNLFKDVWECKVDAVVALSLDRFSRNIRETKKLYDVCAHNNIDFYTVKEGAMDTLKLVILAWQNEEYTDNVSYRTKLGLKTTFKSGNMPFKLVFGYRKTASNIWKVNNKEADIVRHVFEQVLMGTNFTAIADNLNRTTKLRCTQTSFKWTDKNIRNIIKNRKYIGCFVFGEYSMVNHPIKETKVRIKNPEDKVTTIEKPELAIISKDDFENAQRVFKTYEKRKKLYDAHVLHHLVKCSFCRYTMTIGRKEKHVYARCLANKHANKRHCEKPRHVDLLYLTDIVYSRMADDFKKDKEHLEKIQRLYNAMQMPKKDSYTHEELVLMISKGDNKKLTTSKITKLASRLYREFLHTKNDKVLEYLRCFIKEVYVRRNGENDTKNLTVQVVYNYTEIAANIDDIADYVRTME